MLRSTYHASTALSSYRWLVGSSLGDEGDEPTNARVIKPRALLCWRRATAAASSQAHIYTHRRRRTKLISTPGFPVGSAATRPGSLTRFDYVGRHYFRITFPVSLVLRFNDQSAGNKAVDERWTLPSYNLNTCGLCWVRWRISGKPAIFPW